MYRTGGSGGQRAHQHQLTRHQGEPSGSYNSHVTNVNPQMRALVANKYMMKMMLGFVSHTRCCKRSEAYGHMTRFRVEQVNVVG